MLFSPPLSEEDAQTIVHAAEIRILEVALDRSWDGVELAARYGEAKRWLHELLQDRPVEIDEAELAESRKITAKVGR